MANSESEKMAQRLQQIKTDMTYAKVQIETKQERLNELEPLVQNLKTECLNTYKCNIEELPVKIAEKEKELETQLVALEEKIQAAKVG